MRKVPDWITAYLAYTYDQESPESFHIWNSLSNIAGALRRQVWFDMGYFKVYPNLYVVLVAPPGRCKKTTSMRLARDILVDVPGLHFTPDSTSREKLILTMSQKYSDGQSAITAHSGEFASFLATSAENMVGFLTDIFDCPGEWKHETKGTGTNLIRAPFFNLLACTTPDDLARKMSINAVGIGLTSRVIFVYEDTPRIRDPIPTLTADQQALIELLTEDLGTISQIRGEYKFDSPETKESYSKWYRDHLINPNPTGDPRLSGFYERKHIHWLKTAMCMAAAESDELVLTQYHMDRAMMALELVEPNMIHVFAGVGRNPLHADLNEMLGEVLSDPDGVDRGEVFRRMHYSCTREEIESLLMIAKEMGYIRYDVEKRKYFPVDKEPPSTEP